MQQREALGTLPLSAMAFLRGRLVHGLKRLDVLLPVNVARRQPVKDLSPDRLQPVAGRLGHPFGASLR
jgi:hypothetical protein